ncbi:hypothetical protein [Bacillus phage Carmen17]|uniref:Uncharacterized protein n=1 Tax=Bacillus phage Carmen17 TaxID=2072797 RepID=A0A2I7QIN5_9CAUD|nr:replication initiation protein [Bacillus phage Carmen17]AUR81243.1 hypothetical protein [Bacillus phage Carmen17]
MLNIQINEDYKITSSEDGKNVMIEKQIYKEDDIGIVEPTGRYKVDGYFSNVPAAVRGLIKRELNNSDATSFDELIADMERIEKSIMDAMHQFNM